MDGSEQRICALCHCPLNAGDLYVVRIDVFADPHAPDVGAEADASGADLKQQMRELMEQMRHMSAAQLQQQVHERFEYCICPRCRPTFAANPLGLPRHRSPARN